MDSPKKAVMTKETMTTQMATPRKREREGRGMFPDTSAPQSLVAVVLLVVVVVVVMVAGCVLFRHVVGHKEYLENPHLHKVSPLQMAALRPRNRQQVVVRLPVVGGVHSQSLLHDAEVEALLNRKKARPVPLKHRDRIYLMPQQLEMVKAQDRTGVEVVQ
jgi:hypothetical protein